ncbi:MAG TPA: hypothetical protein VEX37_04265 [Thermomicrobiales bacterium]|nr:hypothetical protein [Thermomicrobiales bacterium]
MQLDIFDADAHWVQDNPAFNDVSFHSVNLGRDHLGLRDIALVLDEDDDRDLIGLPSIYDLVADADALDTRPAQKFLLDR